MPTKDTVDRRTIAVKWQCGMGEACTNLKKPGEHDEYADAQKCVHAKEPAALRRLRQF